MGYQAEKKFDDIFSRLDTTHERDGQTDRWTDNGRQHSVERRLDSIFAGCLLMVEWPSGPCCGLVSCGRFRRSLHDVDFGDCRLVFRSSRSWTVWKTVVDVLA